jgi:hypothetical protein
MNDEMSLSRHASTRSELVEQGEDQTEGEAWLY